MKFRVAGKHECARGLAVGLLGLGLQLVWPLIALAEPLVAAVVSSNGPAAATAATTPVTLDTQQVRSDPPLVAVPASADASSRGRNIRSKSTGGFYSRTDFKYEMYKFSRDTVFTAGGVLPFTLTPLGAPTDTPNPVDVARKLLKTERARTKVTRFTVTETLGWKLGTSWAVEAEAPWALATFKGLAGDLQRPPTIRAAATGGDAITNLVGSLATPNNDGDFTRAFGMNVSADPGKATPLELELSSMKDVTLRPRWEHLQENGKHRLTLESSFRLPTGHPRLTQDEQLLVTALGEASLDVDEPYFGKGLDAGLRAKWDVKAGQKREWEFSLGYTSTGSYDQTYSPKLNEFFDQGRTALVDTVVDAFRDGGLLADPINISETAIRDSFGRSITANSRLITRRNPADQASAGLALTIRPHDRRRDQYALAAVRYEGERVNNPAGIVFGDMGDQAPQSVGLRKDPAYQFSYTLDRLVTKSLFGRFRLFYQVQGSSDICTPSGFVVRDLSFGDRWGGDLQFRKKMTVPGCWLSYGMRVNCINSATVRETTLNNTVSDIGIPFSDRREFSAFGGWERQLKEFSFGGTIRLGLTDDAPDLILEAGLRKEF